MCKSWFGDESSRVKRVFSATVASSNVSDGREDPHVSRFARWGKKASWGGVGGQIECLRGIEKKNHPYF